MTWNNSFSTKQKELKLLTADSSSSASSTVSLSSVDAPFDLSLFNLTSDEVCRREAQFDGNSPTLTFCKKLLYIKLARITAILKDVMQDKDSIIARLQQPYLLDCIPVEAEYQKQFSELLMKAASDYGALTASSADFQWSQNYTEPPSVWREMLRPIPVALPSCTRFFEAMSAMRESFATLQNLRVGDSSSLPTTTPASKDPSQQLSGQSECVTPPPRRSESSLDATFDPLIPPRPLKQWRLSIGLAL